MTGNDDDDWILMIRSSDRSDGFRFSDHGGFFEIVSCFSERNLRERIPGVFLELGSEWLQWNLEMLSFSFEIFAELCFCLEEDCIFGFFYFFPRNCRDFLDFYAEYFRIFEFEQREKILTRNRSKIPDRRCDGGSE